ncbi:MAG: hypothetical protein ACRDV3_02135 [Acidothermaceae bacterium]
MERFGTGVDVDLADGQLTVRMRGLDMLLAFRRTVKVPLDHVRGVVVQHRDRVPQIGMYFPGIAVPGVLYAGAFGLGDERSFWSARRAERLLRIECRPGAEFRRIVLEVADPTELAGRLRPVLGAYVPPESV